ncbi:MAG: hypothetical protein MUC61_02015 [Amoebophilaceae bacterium]|nr:hypothetical protein [Amoebophilaceae bacterium]
MNLSLGVFHVKRANEYSRLRLRKKYCLTATLNAVIVVAWGVVEGDV